MRNETATRRIGGLVVHMEFMDTKSRRFCPACLLEDLAPDSPSLGIPVGRIGWQIQSIQACSRHNLILQCRSIRSYSDRFSSLPEFIANEADLRDLVSSAEPCRASALQGYVLNRISGTKGPDWLDSMPIDHAVKTCELLGTLLTEEPGAMISKLSPSQRNRAGDAGFGYASEGAIGLRHAFQVLFNRHVGQERPVNAQKVFGRLYRWLDQKQLTTDLVPVRDLLREFVLNHFPVERGAELLGAPVDRQRVHTARTLAAKSKFHLKTVRRVLVSAGLIADADGNWPVHQIFEADAGRAVIEMIKASISTKGLQKFLNCTRVQAEQLTRSGIIPRLAPVGSACSGVLTNVARNDAEKFLEKIIMNAVEVSEPSDGYLDIAGVAEVLHRPAVDVVATILDGQLERIETFQPLQKFKSLYLHPDDVRRAMSYNPPAGFMTVAEVAKELGLPPDTIYALAGLNAADGVPIFSKNFFGNSEGIQQRIIASAEVAKFSERFITLKEYSETMGISSKSAINKFAIERISPIAPRKLLLRLIYDRRDTLGVEA